VTAAIYRELTTTALLTERPCAEVATSTTRYARCRPATFTTNLTRLSVDGSRAGGAGGYRCRDRRRGRGL
jgi:hypothetical protein